MEYRETGRMRLEHARVSGGKMMAGATRVTRHIR
jgi:hypothetical protein